jgi:hypothetical protein
MKDPQESLAPRTVTVPDPGKGVCADPLNKAAILGKGGSDPQGGNKERQLSPGKGRGKTTGNQRRRTLHGFKMPACAE